MTLTNMMRGTSPFNRARRAAAALLTLALACLPVRQAAAAFTATMDGPASTPREHDLFPLVVTLANTGSIPLTSLAATLSLADAQRASIETSPVIAATQAIDGSAAIQLTWLIRADAAGQETYSVLATALSKGSPVSAEAGFVNVIAPKPAAAAAFPNPVAGDTLRVALNLTDNADEVTAEVYNASFHRIATAAWRDVARGDGQVTLQRVGEWAPGVYAIRMKARLAGGGEQTFPLIKVRVKR